MATDFDPMADLSEMQRRFVEQLLLNPSMYDAAVASGYSPKTASAQASRLLKKAKIQAALKYYRDKSLAATGLTLTKVLKEIERLAFSDVRKLYNADGSLKAVHELDDDTAAAVLSVEYSDKRVPKSQAVSGVGVVAPGRLPSKIRLADKKGPLEILKQHFDRMEGNGGDDEPANGNGPVSKIIVDIRKRLSGEVVGPAIPAERVGDVSADLDAPVGAADAGLSE